MAFRKLDLQMTKSEVVDFTDAVMVLAKENTSSTVDIGIMGRIGVNTYAGLVRDGETGKFFLIDNYALGSTVTSNAITEAGITAHATLELENLIAKSDVVTYSDARFKHNVVTIDNALEKVNAMRGVEYEKGGKQNIGVIAQEVEVIVPEVVHTDPEGMKSVAYGNLVGLLIESIKELTARVESLEKQIFGDSK
jgi:hypothetical protein